MMRILFVSDFHHLNQYPQAESGYKAVFNEMDNTLDVLASILQEHTYDLLVIGGDLCEDGAVSDYAAVKKVLEEHNKQPYLITLGNHDIKENFYAVFDEIEMNAFGHYTMSFNDYKLISFDSSVHDIAEGEIHVEDQAWLLQEIQNSKEDVLVLTHHHLLDYQHETEAVGISDELLEALKSPQVKLVLTAHTHTPFVQKFDTTTFVTTGSLSFRAHGNQQGQLVFDNERYYTLIDLGDYVSVQHQNIQNDYQVFETLTF